MTVSNNEYVIDCKTNKINDTFWSIADWGDGSYTPKQYVVVKVDEHSILVEPTNLRNTKLRLMEGNKYYATYDACEEACKQLMEK